MTIEEQLQRYFGLNNPTCKNLNMPTNDVIEVTTPDGGHFALKMYNAASRKVADVQWAVDLTLHLIKNGAPVVKPVAGNAGYIYEFAIGGQSQAAVLFEWAAGSRRYYCTRFSWQFEKVPAWFVYTRKEMEQ